MSTSATAEIYFIGAMMILILVICIITVFFFFRQYRREMRNRKTRPGKDEQIGTPGASEEGGGSQ